MKTRIKNVEECRKLFQIEIPPEAVEKAVSDVYQEIKKIAKIPGFRPGTAPQDLLEKHYDKDAREEVLKRLIPQGYNRALEDHKVTPVGYPQFSNINFERNKPLTFDAEVDTEPALKLKKYTKIKVTRKRISVSQDEINQAIERLKESYAKHKDVEGPVKKGDYAVCDVEAFLDGVAITKKNHNMWIMADKEASLLGLGENLVGMKKGDKKEIDAMLPGNYPDKKYAGKLARFHITVNDIKEKELPELNGEFAKNFNQESMESLKKEIGSQILARKESDVKVNMKNQILDSLLKENRFAVPPGIVTRQKEVFAKRLELELAQKGVKKEDADKKIKELDQRLSEDAKNKVKIYFLLDRIATNEKIEVSPEDIDERVRAVAASTGRPEKEVRDYYEKENLTAGLREEIKEDKVLDFLLREADIVNEKL